jgi:hypothetical protein
MDGITATITASGDRRDAVEIHHLPFETARQERQIRQRWHAGRLASDADRRVGGDDL